MGLLPKCVVPTSYILELNADLEGCTFRGVVTIKCDIVMKTNVIILNAAELNIDSVETPGHANTFSLNKGEELLTITLKDEELVAGQSCSIKITYSGSINDKLRGFYRFRPSVPDSKFSFYGSTHFEATGARFAFPCWDEPCFRATFQIKITCAVQLNCFSNMPEDREALNEGDNAVHSFQMTPSMPTYLVGWSIGKFDALGDTSHDGKVKLQVICPKGLSESARFPLHIAKECIKFYQDFFGVAYPLPKMDLIAIADFPIGAMENWGLITFKESRLLCSDNVSFRDKQIIAIIVAHEIAHMWFGNLVTIDWWDDLWLKEGFASFMEFLCVDAIHPEMKVMELFSEMELCRALRADCKSSSHPIQADVAKPSEIDNIFDFISYAKGASVIYMMYGFLGVDTFKQGLAKYLEKYAYGCGKTAFLWECMQSVAPAGTDITAIMSDYTKRMGYPLITISSDDEKSVTLKQTSFSLPEMGGITETKDYMWSVPLKIVDLGDSSKVIWEGFVGKGTTPVTIPLPSPTCRILVNPGGTSYCRVAYSSSLLASLLEKDGVKLPGPDMIYLFDNLLATSKVGLSPMTDVLRGLEYLFKTYIDPIQADDHINIVTSSLGDLVALKSLASAISPQCKASFETWLKGCLPVDKFAHDSRIPSVSRSKFISACALYEGAGLADHYRAQGDAFITDKIAAKQPCNDEFSLGLCKLMCRFPGNTLTKYEDVFTTVYTESTDPARRSLALECIAAMPLTVTRLTWARKHLRIQDLAVFMSLVTSGVYDEERQTVAREWFEANAISLIEEFGKSQLLRHLTGACVGGGFDPDSVRALRDRLPAEFRQHKVASAAIEQQITNAESQKAWLSRYQHLVEGFQS